MIDIEKKWKKRVIELEKQIRIAEEEITMIQMSCDHNEYHIAYHGWRTGGFDTMRICNICNTPFGEPLKEELKQFEKENNEGQGKKTYCNETD
jgi:phage terminase small subunit